MKKKTIFFGILSVLTLLGGIVLAAEYGRNRKQDGPLEAGDPMPAAATEYAAVMAHYRGVDSAMDVAGTIRIYDGEKKDSLRESRTFRCYRWQDQFYWQLSYLRTYCNGRYVVQLDTVDQAISVSRAGDGAADRMSSGMQAPLLFSDTGRFRLSGTVEPAGADRMLVLHSDGYPQIRECRLVYDTARYRLRRAEIEWWKSMPAGGTNGGPVWLGKIAYDPAGRTRPDIAGAIDSIVAIEGNTVVARPRYTNYKLNVNF